MRSVGTGVAFEIVPTSIPSHKILTRMVSLEWVFLNGKKVSF